MNHTLFIIIFFLIGLSNAQTVTIGTQVWMTKNLDVATFRNGDPIPEAKSNEEWEKAGENKQPAWCYYNNDPANGAKYGKLYNWYAVNDPRGLAPEGWHVPNIDEWDECLNRIKIDDAILCNECIGSPRISIGSTNKDFSKQLVGCRFNYMAKEFYGFIGLFESSYFWSSNEIDNWGEFVLIGDDQALGIFNSNLNGFSIRCIKD